MCSPDQSLGRYICTQRWSPVEEKSELCERAERKESYVFWFDLPCPPYSTQPRTGQTPSSCCGKEACCSSHSVRTAEGSTERAFVQPEPGHMEATWPLWEGGCNSMLTTTTSWIGSNTDLRQTTGHSTQREGKNRTAL
jgi:hypothetical protein